MTWYINFVVANPILSAVIQFAILGTLGETISKWIVKKRIHSPFSLGIYLWKMVVWAILAVGIKYAFTGMKGFVDALVEHSLLPKAFETNIYIRAFGLSFLTNIQFGLFLVLFHRVLDNLVLTQKNWKGLDKAMLSLLWFWIPAHTVTFSLPKDYQIGLAALWSVVLGIILGFFNMRNK